MPFIRRFREFPSIETLQQTSAVNIVDRTPQTPATGVGSGALLVVGEFEDGPFAGKGDADEYDRTLRNLGPQEVVGAVLANVFGGFGFTYGSTPYQNPCARKHLQEFWNGNGFIKLKWIKALRLMIARVDTSVGSVAFTPRASLIGNAGPFPLVVGETLSFTTDTGGPTASTAIAAVEAVKAGAVFVTSGFVGGETIVLTIDHGPATRVVFAATDSTPAQVAAKINAVMGYTCAVVNAGAVDLHGIRKGTNGQVVTADGTTGALASIGQTAATTNGTGNVADLSQVTAAEVASIVNGTAGLAAINVAASVDPSGQIRFSRSGAPGSILVAAGAMATALGLNVIGTAVLGGEHAAGTIPAGTRVSDGTHSWVTMQTLKIAAGTHAAPNVGPHVVKVRPAQDDGTAVGAIAGAVTTVTDQPAFAQMGVTNPNALSAALTEVQMDVAYQAALDATLDPTKATREANYLVIARHSDLLDRAGTANAEYASSIGFFGRKFVSRAFIGSTEAQALAAVAANRSDRRFFTFPGWQTNIPEIATLGTAGGTGFTPDGNITVGADGPLAMLRCLLNPEENIGQATGLIEQFFAVEDIGHVLQIDDYIAFKAAGICAPRRDPTDGSLYQDEPTSSLTPGLLTQKRRAMADYIQDSIARLMGPYQKRLATTARRDGAEAVQNSFLGTLKAENQPSLQRIADFSVSDKNQTPDLTSRGIFVWQDRVQMLSSMDAIVLDTEIGEGVLIITETV